MTEDGMNASDFERISRVLADHRLTRRTLTQGGAGLVAAVAATEIAGASVSSARQATPIVRDDVELLFVQSFQGGRITSGDGGAFQLTLEHTLRQTIYFSDRPNRVVGAMATSDFLGMFEQAAAADPPNAALVAEGADGEMILIVELMTAGFDDATGTLTYDVTMLGEEDVDMQFEHAVGQAPTAEVALETGHLFIDSLGACTPWDPRC
jgi:hypothetical protein